VKIISALMCLVTAVTSSLPLFAQCQTAGTGVSEVKGGYEIVLPAELIGKVPTNQTVQLVLRNAQKRVASVSGRIHPVGKDKLRLETREKLAFSPVSCKMQVALQASTVKPGGCFDAEHGSSCWLTFCAGTTFCVPGPGPGGMQCACL
jgi:hypothetical protein